MNNGSIPPLTTRFLPTHRMPPSRMIIPPFLHAPRAFFLLRALLAAFLFVGCAVGPDYRRPDTPVPANWKDALWKTAEPRDITLDDRWWKIFDDVRLNELEERALNFNQELKAAFANVEQARALSRVARSELLPSLRSSGLFQRQRDSEDGGFNLPGRSLTRSSWSIPADLSYELDVFGRVRRSFEAARADAQGAAAAYGTILLSLTADVATNYWNLRSVDAQLSLLRSTVGLRREALDLVQSQFDAGAASDFELSQAETELASAEAGVFALERSRAQLENALAILTGSLASDFTMASMPLDNVPPGIPAGIPSALLERRPDVAEAERQMAAASARIGVAKAAFFPSISLTSSAGVASEALADLFRWGSRTWAFAPSIVLPLFEGGRLRADLDAAKANYEAAAAIYRQQVLVAFQDVENALSAIRLLAGEVEAASRATAASARTAEIAFQRYREGAVSYRDVVETQRTALNVELEQVRAQGDRMVATVALIRALGGGWRAPY